MAHRRQSMTGAARSYAGVREETEIVGTPPYMALEVLQGRPHSAKSDVWSFGIVLWNLLEEQPPDLLEQEGKTSFGPDAISLFAGLLTAGARLRLSPRAPSWGAGIYGLCVRENPRERPTFSEILQALEQ